MLSYAYNSLFSDFDTMLNYYKQKWNNYKWEIENVVVLLQIYCGITNILASHANIIAEIINPYLGDTGYLKKLAYNRYLHNLVCRPEYLLFKISIKIPKKDIRIKGGMQALLQVVKDKTGIDINIFYNEDSPLHAFFRDKSLEEMDEHLISHHSWIKFFLDSANDFPPLVPEDSGNLAHAINFTVLQKRMDSRLIEILPEEIPEGDGLVCFLSHMNESNYISYCVDLNDLVDNAVANLPDKVLTGLLELALKEERYPIAYYLFCKAEKIPFKNDGGWLAILLNDYEGFFITVCYSITQPVNNTHLTKIINHGGSKETLKDADKLYRKLWKISELIGDFPIVEQAFLNICKPDLYKVFVGVISDQHKKAIDCLLDTKLIDLKNNKIISCSNKQYQRNRQFEFYQNNDTTMTPVQALFVAGYGMPCKAESIEFILNILLKFIKNDRNCILQSDNLGVGSLYYFLQLKALYHQFKISERTHTLLRKLEMILRQSLVFNKYILLIEYGFVHDLAMIICLLIVEKGLDPVFDISKSFSMLDYDEKIFNFENSLTHNKNDAAEIFCKVHNIVKKGRLLTDIGCLCSHIDKPVDGVFILKYFDYIFQDTSDYKYIPNENDFLRLCRVRHLISHWTVVENKFFQCFCPDLIKGLNSLLNNNDASCIEYIAYLSAKYLNEVEGKFDNLPVMSLLQALLVKRGNFDLIEKMIKFDSSYLLEKDSTGKDFYDYYDDYKKTSIRMPYDSQLKFMLSFEYKKEVVMKKSNLLFSCGFSNVKREGASLPDGDMQIQWNGNKPKGIENGPIIIMRK